MPYGLHVVGPARILDTTATTIQQVEGQAYNLGNDKQVKSSAGQVYKTYTALMAQAPRFQLTSEMIATFLARVGVEGVILSTGFEQYNQLVDSANGKRATGGVHQKFAMANCLVLPRRLTVSQDQPAKLDFDVIGINSAGTTNPVVVTESVSLPTVAGISELFTLGPIKVNGTQVLGVQSLSIDFGLREMIRKHSGAPYPMLAALAEINPKISINLDDAGQFATFSNLGLAQNGTPSLIYLRKMSDNGVRVADGTAQHISFTINKGLWLPNSKGGSHPNEQSTDVEMEPTYDGTNAPMILNTATTIV